MRLLLIHDDMDWLTQRFHEVNHVLGASGFTIPEGDEAICEMPHLFIAHEACTLAVPVPVSRELIKLAMGSSKLGTQGISTSGQASDIAEQQFPDSARDSSTKNAFRHALGTGMVAQGLGGGALGAALAKGIGYSWEGWGLYDQGTGPAHVLDTKHDLNANAIGADVSQKTNNQQEMITALRNLALQSVPVKPPGFFEPSPGYLTRTEQ